MVSFSKVFLFLIDPTNCWPFVFLINRDFMLVQNWPLWQMHYFPILSLWDLWVLPMYSFSTSNSIITLPYNFNWFYTLFVSFKLGLSFCLSISLIPIILPCPIDFSLLMSPIWQSFVLMVFFQSNITLLLVNHKHEFFKTSIRIYHQCFGYFIFYAVKFTSVQ